MKSTRAISVALAGMSVFVCASLLIPGCGGTSSPDALAAKALAPVSTMDEITAREKAMIDLTSLPPNEKGVQESLRKVLEKSDQPRMRCLAMDALANMDDFDSGPLFIKALSSEDKLERARGYHAISKVMGTQYAFPFNNDDEEERKPGLKTIQNAYDFWKAHPEKLEQKKAARAAK
jgi:hypothetical protein